MKLRLLLVLAILLVLVAAAVIWTQMQTPMPLTGVFVPDRPLDIYWAPCATLERCPQVGTIPAGEPVTIYNRALSGGWMWGMLDPDGGEYVRLWTGSCAEYREIGKLGQVCVELNPDTMNGAFR